MSDVLAVVERSGLDEAFHHGAIAVADTSGRVVAVSGDADRTFWVRSSAKPFQASVCVDLGADLPPEHLAVACASHDGTAVHTAIVAAILAEGGLTEADLRCPPDRPMTRRADRRLAASGSTGRSAILHNCSGKHAAMLRACVAQGWPTSDYLDPRHPLQQAISLRMEEVGALADDRIGVDGCGAPVFPITVSTFATAFTALLDSRHRRVWSAMHRFPALVSGMGNVDSVIAVGLDGVAKRGAEGLLAVTVRGRGSLVVRCWDGAERAVAVAARGAMEQLGWMGDRTPFADQLDRAVVGGGRPVGTVRPAFTLEDR